MSEGNQIQSKILIPGHLKDKTRKGPNRQLTFEVVSDWIKIQGFDEYTTNGLIGLAAKYPTNALGSFRRNFNLMIARVRQQRREEQHQEERNKNGEERNKNGEEKTDTQV